MILEKNSWKSANINTLEWCFKASLVDNCGIRLNYLLFYSSSLHYTQIHTVQDDSVCMLNVSGASPIMIVKTCRRLQAGTWSLFLNQKTFKVNKSLCNNHLFLFCCRALQPLQPPCNVGSFVPKLVKCVQYGFNGTICYSTTSSYWWLQEPHPNSHLRGNVMISVNSYRNIFSLLFTGRFRYVASEVSVFVL